MKKHLSAALILALCWNSSQAAITSVGLDKTQYTSDFLMGSVAVSIIFVESNGQLDANTETWSDARKSQVLSEIMSGLDWWTQQNPRAPLSFTYVSQTVTTKYEPINRPYYDEALWIPEIMGKLGFSGNRFISTRNYDHNLRTTMGTDWAYTIFVVDSLNDANGKFTDGLFAYAYLGGPFLVMTYDNNGYGINNMDVVVAHETGHVFHALDQYGGASSPSQYSYGYFPTINGNHEYASTANTSSSIMRGGIRWGLDNWARQMLGWRDQNNNEMEDILDQNPGVSVNSQITSFSSGSSGFAGQATVSVLPRQGNAQGHGLTIDTIAQVEFKPQGGDWTHASPADGHFDSATETFQIVVTPSGQGGSQSFSAQSLDVRVTTLFTLLSGAGGSSYGVPAADLSNAHAFPNPFKPNSGLGHNLITFTGLSDSAKVQVFTTAGEPVWDQTAVAGANSLTWGGVDDGGKKISSGVYYFLITDPAGHKKKGKLAIIR